MTVARTACLVSRTLFSWDDLLLLSNNTIDFLSLYLWRLGRTQKTLCLNPTTLSASCWSSGQLQGRGPEQTARPASSFSGVPLWSPTATEPRRLCYAKMTLSVSKQTGACMSTRLFGCLSMFTCVQLKHGHAGKTKFNGCSGGGQLEKVFRHQIAPPKQSLMS